MTLVATTKYQIFQPTEDGLMKHPRYYEGYYGYQNLSDDFDTIENAIEELKKHDMIYQDYLIIPVVRIVQED